MIIRFLSLCALVLTCSISALAGDPYTVSGVSVDATADNALAAQTQAISEGQMIAANILVDRMSLYKDRAAKNFQGVSQEDGAKMIRALEIANEKRSADRYLGDITVAFNRSAVSQYMRAKGLTLVSTQSRNRLVIPVLEGEALWSSNDWAEAWQTANNEYALTPMQAITPRQELDGIITDPYAEKLDIRTLQAIGQVFGVQQILIAKARPNYPGYSVYLTDVALDTKTSRNIGRVSGSSAEEAVNAAVSAVEENWKESVVGNVSSSSVVLPVSVLYRSQSEWLQLQDVINGSAQIRSARLEALSKTGALMGLTYGGDLERLRNELSFKGVSLRQDQKLGMVLFRTGAF